jgi:hypothetical protein
MREGHAGRNDDMVDCCSLLGQLISDLVPGSEPRKKEPPKVLSTDPAICNITLNDLWAAQERKTKGRSARIW